MSAAADVSEAARRLAGTLGSVTEFAAALTALGDAAFGASEAMSGIEVHDIAPIPSLQSIAADLAERKQRDLTVKNAEKIALGHLHGLNRHQKRCLERQHRRRTPAKPL